VRGPAICHDYRPIEPLAGSKIVAAARA
jgi:hypothetical protein